LHQVLRVSTLPAAAFTIDPLFQQTSAQFDEGGAKGLLLNNLSVFRGCEIVFDSGDVPDRDSTKSRSNSGSEKWVNLTFLQDKVQAMCRGVQAAQHISPTLQEIVKLLNDPYRTAAEAEKASESFGGESGEAFLSPVRADSGQPAPSFGWGGGDYTANLEDDAGSYGGGDDWWVPDEDDEGQICQGRPGGDYEPGVSFASDGEEDVVRWLEGGAHEGRSKSWAGADHWRAKGRPKGI
jgi:condensin complex subunit 2